MGRRVRHHDALVIGGGIVGAALLDRLAAQGIDALLIERETLASGSTGRSIGMLGIMAETEFDIRLRQESAQFYQALAEDDGLPFVRCGHLQLARTPEEAKRIERMVALTEQFDERVELLSPSDLNRLVPGLTTNPYLLAGYAPDDGHFDGHELATGLIARARAHGAQIQTGTAAQALLTSADGRRLTGVQLPQGKFHADRVIVAAGPWTPSLLTPIGLSLPTSGVPGQILVVRHDFGTSLPMVLERESHLYLRGEGTHRALFGELDVTYRPDGGVAPEQMRTHPSKDFVEQAIAHWTEALPAFCEATAEGGWVGLRVLTPDGRPLIGPTSVEGLWVATGFSGHGIQLAPAAARILADALQGCGSIPRALASDRFEGQ